MTTFLSPGIAFTEYDDTTIVPAVPTTTGGIAGVFNWGPVGERILVDTETHLAEVFGKPNSNNADTWFTAASFLGYSSSLYVVRCANCSSNVANTGALNAIANTDAVSNQLDCVVLNSVDFDNKYANGQFDINCLYVAKYPGGTYGNSLRIGVCDSVNAYSSKLYANGAVVNATAYGDAVATLSVNIGSSNASLVFSSPTSNAAAVNAYMTQYVQEFQVGDYITLGNTAIGVMYGQVKSISNTDPDTYTLSLVDPYMLHTDFVSNTTVNPVLTRNWEFFRAIGTPPQQTAYQASFGNTSAVDGMHVVVVDEGGAFSGVPGTVLETYQNLSRATDSVTVGGSSNYYRTVLNQSSKYVWAVNDRTQASSNTAKLLASSNNSAPLDLSFVDGTDGYSEDSAPLSVIATGYDLFSSSQDVSVSLLMQGHPTGGSTVASDGVTVTNTQLANYIIQNIAASRRDCVAFVTPDDAMVLNNQNNEAQALVDWRNALTSSSYAVCDSGYKQMYDRYNDVYRYVPSNGDIAGLCAYTDYVRAPWWSPAFFNRGQLKNVVQMRWNPSEQAERDLLYQNGINPVVSFPGQGTVLYGDKTMLSAPSAFDRINVRRLFIVLETAIDTAMKYYLGEFNDSITRAAIMNVVNPYLQTIQAQRGIQNFDVICDSTNNTGEVIDSDKLVLDVYVKPSHAIDFIQVNYVAVKTSVSFSEIVGTLG